MLIYSHLAGQCTYLLAELKPGGPVVLHAPRVRSESLRIRQMCQRGNSRHEDMMQPPGLRQSCTGMRIALTLMSTIAKPAAKAPASNHNITASCARICNCLRPEPKDSPDTLSPCVPRLSLSTRLPSCSRKLWESRCPGLWLHLASRS